jgi:hypothetical protein
MRKLKHISSLVLSPNLVLVVCDLALYTQLVTSVSPGCITAFTCVGDC